MESLPLELVDAIGKHLTLKDQHRLRLTCWTYYQLFPDGLDAVMTPKQRNHYYKLLFCFQHHHVAIDESPNEVEKLTVALILCRMLDLSFTFIVPPADKLIGYFELAQRYGVRDPMITSVESLEEKIIMRPRYMFQPTQISNEWINRVTSRTLIVVSGKNDPAEVRRTMRMLSLSGESFEYAECLKQSRIIYHPPDPDSLSCWFNAGLGYLDRPIRYLIERLTIAMIIPIEAIGCLDLSPVYDLANSWCHRYLPPDQIKELDTIKESLLKTVPDPDPTIYRQPPDRPDLNRMLLTNEYYNSWLMTIVPKYVLPRLCFKM